MEATQKQLVVELEQQVRATPQKVWNILSSREGMQSWLGPVSWEPQTGGRVLFDVSHDGTRWLMFGEVLAMVENEALAFSWQEFDTGTLIAWPAATRICITITPQDSGCLVRLNHSGFEGLADPAGEHASYVEGWTSRDVMAKLARLCEEQS
jgi:uncharacterized protein YndB with AHSA1/START domain